jgi:hypothetical protein
MPDKEQADELRAFAEEIRLRRVAAAAAAAAAQEPITITEFEEITRVLTATLRDAIIANAGTPRLADCHVFVERLMVPYNVAKLSLERKV